MTERDWKKELAEPGKSIGLAYKTRNGNKIIIFGDKRLLGNNSVDFPLLSNRFSHTKDGKYYLNGDYEHDIVGAWEEPKPKKLIAMFTYKGISGKFYIIDYAQTKEDAEKYIKQFGGTNLIWPFPGTNPFEVDDE